MADSIVRFKKGEYLCVYCVERPGVEKEHVIPRGFFLPEDSGRRITVPACAECNHRFSKDEEYVRAAFTMEFRGSDHPTARSLFDKGKAYRALEQNRKLLDSMLRGSRETRVRTRGGIELPGTYYAIPQRKGPVERFIDKVVRGVFFADTGEHMPRDYTIEYCTDDRLNAERIRAWAGVWLVSRPIGNAGNNVFQYRFARTIGVPMATVWVMRFYEGLTYTVFSRPPSVDSLSYDMKEGSQAHEIADKGVDNRGPDDSTLRCGCGAPR